MGKKSGPLAFLNKKGWHPGNQRNQEKVWKKEQEALAEKKQVEELRKQYEEARQKEEVEAMAIAAGVKKKQERLDWMYQGGMVAKQEAEKRADAQMLGEKEVDLPAVQEPAKADQVAQLPAFYTQDTPASANEMWQKLHGDPMFAIKQQELMARKNIVANPVQMDAIKKRLKDKAQAKAARKAARAEAKAAKKAAKKAKKDKKRKKEESSSSESESDGSEDARSLKRAKLSNGSLAAPSRRGDHEGHERRTQNGHEHNDDRARRRQAQNGRESERQSDRDRLDSREERHRRDHRSRDEAERGHSDRKNSGRNREAESEREADRRDSRRSRERSSREHAERPAERTANGRSRASEPAKASDRGDSRREEVTVYQDAASAQGQDLSYGLNTAANAVEEDRDERRKATQKRLEEARARHESEEKKKADQRYKRKEHRTGQLSEEEKARRLAEMSGNADAHEEARWSRLQAARKRDDTQAEEEALTLQQKAAATAKPGTHHKDTARFLQQATNQTYSGEHASLADRIGRRKYYNDRSRDESQGAFQR